MNSRIKFVIFICLLAGLLAPSPAAASDLGSPVDIPLQSLNGDQAIDLVGLASGQTVNVQIPDAWAITNDSWLEIDITASQMLDLEKASLTISLNNFQVASYRLADVTGTKQRINLPANMFKPGVNTLTFAARLYMPDDLKTNCQGADDPSRWVLIGPQSALHLSYQKQNLPIDLTHFPEALVQPIENYLPAEGNKTVFVLPDDIQKDDLNALAATSYFLGHAAGENFIWHPEILTESKFDPLQYANNNLVFLNNIPLPLKNEIAVDKDAVAMFPSPWNGSQAAMVIVDHNRQDSYSPTLVFGDPMRRVLLRGNVAFLDKINPSPPPAFQNRFSFEDLGYLDRTIRGIGKGDLIYRIFIPYNVNPTTATLFLQLSHSTDLDSETSSFSVYLNGFTVASIVPTARSAKLDPIQVDLPLNRFRPGINFLRLTFDLHLPTSNCAQSPESAWATVFKNSTVDMTYQNRMPIASLKDFPLPFNDYPSFTFVIPNEKDQQTLNRIAQLAFAIGETSPFVNLPPELISAKDFAVSKTDRPNLILVGLPTENTTIREINNLLPQPFTNDGKQLQEGFGVFLPTSDQNASTGLLQIIHSPWVDNGTILVLTGNDTIGLDWSWNVILDPAMRKQFSGNIMVVGSEKRIGSLSNGDYRALNVQFQQTADVSNIPVFGQLLQNSKQSRLISSLVAVIVAMIVVLVALNLFSKFKVMVVVRDHPAIKEAEKE